MQDTITAAAAATTTTAATAVPTEQLDIEQLDIEQLDIEQLGAEIRELSGRLCSLRTEAAEERERLAEAQAGVAGGVPDAFDAGAAARARLGTLEGAIGHVEARLGGLRVQFDQAARAAQLAQDKRTLIRLSQQARAAREAREAAYRELGEIFDRVISEIHGASARWLEASLAFRKVCKPIAPDEAALDALLEELAEAGAAVADALPVNLVGDRFPRRFPYENPSIGPNTAKLYLMTMEAHSRVETQGRWGG